MAHCPSEEMDMTCVDYESRIDELTALIDGLTGGEFGRNVVK